MKIGGQIPWNVIPFCETSKISCLMGRPHMKDALENHLKDRLFHLVHWLSITLSLRKTSQESINLERKYYLDYSLDTHLYAEWKFGRVTYWLQTLRSWRRWTHRKFTQKDPMRKGSDISQRKWKIHIPSRRWTKKSLEEIRKWEHPPWYGSTQFEENIKEIFQGESEGSPQPLPQDSLPDAGEARNDFWSISGNFTNRHHDEPRVKLYTPREESFPIPLKYIDVSRTTQTNLDVKQRKPHRWLFEYRWIKRFVWFLDRFHPIYSIKWETSRRIFVVWGETDKTASDIQARSFMARTLERNVKER